MRELPDDFKAGVRCDARWLGEVCFACNRHCLDILIEAYFKKLPSELFVQHVDKCSDLQWESEQLKYGKSIKGMVYDVAGRVYVFYICRECCNKIGIKLYDNQEEIEDIMKDLCSSSVDFGFHEYFDGDYPDVF